MGCVSSKHDTSLLRQNTFAVTNVDEAGQPITPGQLQVTDTELVYRQRTPTPGTVTRWQLCHLRKYGFDSEIFSFECGRRCPTGAGIYAFRCKRAEQLFNMLQHSIQVGNLTDAPTTNSTTLAPPNDYPIPLASTGPPVTRRNQQHGSTTADSTVGGYLNPTVPATAASNSSSAAAIRSHTVVRPDSVTSSGTGNGPNSPVSPLNSPPATAVLGMDMVLGGLLVERNNNKRGSLGGCGGGGGGGIVANGYTNAQVVMEQAALAAGTPTYINLLPTSTTTTPATPTVPPTALLGDANINTYVNITPAATTTTPSAAYMNVCCPPTPGTPAPVLDLHALAAELMLPPMGAASDDDRQHCYANVMEPLALMMLRGSGGSVPGTPTGLGVSNYAQLDLPRISATQASTAPSTTLSHSATTTSTSSQVTTSPFSNTNSLSVTAPGDCCDSAQKPYVTIDWHKTNALSQTVNQQLIGTEPEEGSRKTRHNSTIGDLMPMMTRQSSLLGD